MRVMRIVIHDYGGYPFTAQLARSLAGRGHEVLYLHGGGLRPARGRVSARDVDPPTLTSERVAISEPLRSRAGLRRLLQERRYGKALSHRIVQHRPDVVLSVPSSLDAQAAAQRAAHANGAAFVFWLQDIYSQAIERLLGRGIPLGGRLIASRFARLERLLLRTSDAVVSISGDFLPILRSWSVPDSRVIVIPNWAPLDEIEPAAKDNPWSREHGLAEAAVLLYAGTLGRKHDPGLLVSLADALPSARIAVVSEGVGTERLRARLADRDNLVLLPLQPAERLGEVLATGDILVAILDEDANVFSVPSKVLTYLTAGRAILAAIPPVNLAARTIGDAGAGRVVPPSDAMAFVAAAKELMANRDLRLAAGAAGRSYAEKTFEIGPITDRFESVLEAAVQRAHSGGVRKADTAETQ